MNFQRKLVLVLGPLAILVVNYWLAFSTDNTRLAAATSRGTLQSSNSTANIAGSLQLACEQTAQHWTSQLGTNCPVVVRSPFVLAGNVSEAELLRQYSETIVPTVRALSFTYFDTVPNEPIVILMFADRRSFESYAVQLDGRNNADYYGYYLKSDRRVVVNLATGNGTLAHELTHALAHFDFPNMPEWFDEGLASLYEQSEFSDDEMRLVGVSNWRIHYLLQAVRQRRLRSLDELISAGRVRDQQEGLDYAHARYLCLYLQQRDLLSQFYREFRANLADDATGRATLLEVLQADDFAAIDQEFEQWVRTLQPVATAH